jgi:hypothetical protein
LSWALSRFKKDRLGNAWVGSLPSFLRFVGVTRVDPTNVVNDALEFGSLDMRLKV